MAELVNHALGCHLNQRHEDYLLDAGLGYGAVKEIFLSPTEWWDASPHNPLRDTSKDGDLKKAFQRGTALHTHVLDGPKVYDRLYGFMPNAASHPNALDTVRDLTAACQRLGLSTAGQKADLVRTLLGVPKRRGRKLVYEPKAEVLAHLQDMFVTSGKKLVTREDDARIKMLYRMMMRSAQELKLPDGDHLTLKDALHKALTEVSVYWIDDDGIRQRARFDILKPNFSGDLKSITQWKRTDFKKSLLKEVILRGYMIQSAHYHHGRVALRQAVDEGRVFGGNKTQRRLLERIALAEEWAWLFIFAKMDGAPQVRGIVISPESNQFKKALAQREEALANFIWQREFHGGLDVPWFDPDVIWEPDENEWPLFSVLGES